MSYKILYYCTSTRETEEIDEAGSKSEAESMVNEYRMAFNGAGSIWKEKV